MEEDTQTQSEKQVEPIGETEPPKDLEFNEEDLEVVEISDDGLKVADQTAHSAKKDAKKIAKKLRTPEETKKLRKKQLLIGIGGLLVLLLILLAVPFTRWPILNLVGLRGNLQVTALDQETKKPISKATVKLEDGSFGVTSTKGVITFSGSKLGARTVVVQKAGYADTNSKVINGLGETKSTQRLKAIGIKLDVDVKNWLSGVVIDGATVSYRDSSALSDKTGRASLIIPPTDQPKVTLTITAPSYLTKEVSTDVDISSREVLLVSSQKDYFISKRDGKFDIFSSNLDGTNQQKIIEATGKEDEGVLAFSVNRTDKQAVLVATREGKTLNNKVIAGVYLVDLEKASLKKVDEGSDIQLLDWSDNSIAYTKSIPELNYDDASLSRLMNLNISTAKLSEIAQANYFAIALVAQNKLFYLPANPYNAVENGVLTSQDLGSNAKKTYLTDKPLRYASRATFSTLELQATTGANFELQIASGAAKAIDHRPSTSLSFALSPDSQQTTWSDRRDGQGALLTRGVKTTEDKTVVKSGGLSAPVRFVTDDLVIVRIATSQETADYVVSIASGKISKIVDLSNIGAGGSGALYN